MINKFNNISLCQFTGHQANSTYHHGFGQLKVQGFLQGEVWPFYYSFQGRCIPSISLSIYAQKCIIVVTARIRSMTGRYCFHRCLSVNISGGGDLVSDFRGGVTWSQIFWGGVPGLRFSGAGVPGLSKGKNY